MRESKFRGKRIDNGEWVYGGYQADVMCLGKHTIFYCKNEGFYCEDEVDHETVGEFTGLCDKNGVGIYEGDIVKGTTADMQIITNGIVSFDICAYIVKYTEGSASGFYYLHHILLDSVEVIGNIHDNPELLPKTANN